MSEENISAFRSELVSVLAISFEEFSEEKKLNDLQAWDSLAIVSIMAMLAQYFDVNVSGREVEQCHNFTDLLMLAKKSQSAKK